MSIYEQIQALLEKHNIPYRLTEHEPVRTREEAARIRGVALDTIPIIVERCAAKNASTPLILGDPFCFVKLL